MAEEGKELLLFQLGPVQEFIAQAETIGDLRAGSELLSELTAAALERVPEYWSQAVFPAVGRGELSGIPNRFLVFVPQGEGERIAKVAAGAAKAKLMDVAATVWGELGGRVPRERREEFMAQASAFLQTSWAVLKTPSGKMGEDYKTIGKLMAMRRNVRQFDAWHEEAFAAVKDFLSGKEAALDVIGDSAPNKNSGRGAMNLIKQVRASGFDRRAMGNLGPYIAVIAMDGDRMGENLSRLASKEAHRDFSGQLAEFARKVRIEPEDGILIYAGGDDVLAVVKAARAIEISRRLSGQFQEMVKGGEVTVSAGIAIGSVKAPLQDLIHAAHAAESRAKRKYGRNALAVSVLKRSGESLEWGCKWDSRAFDIYGRLALREGDFSRFAYKLAGFLGPYELGRSKTIPWGDMKAIVLAETRHVIAKTEGAKSVLPVELLEAYLDEELIEKYPQDYLGLFLCEAFINRPRD